MRLIVWNCRGLGNGPAVRGLLDVQKQEDPDVLFLSETKHDSKWMEWWRWKLNMTNMFVVDSVGASGGLALFWKKEVVITVKSFSKYHIDAEVREEDGLVWRFTGVYGESKSEEKDNTWNLLRALKSQNDLPWLCSGDFNEILFNCEKEGGCLRSEGSMQKFRHVLEDCDLHDLGFVGDAFTWRNHHHDAASYTKERLDRAVANSGWRCCFPLVRVINGEQRHSDHRPIIVEIGERYLKEWKKQGEIMRKFEASWLEEMECKNRVQEAWALAVEGGGTCLMDLQSKVLTELWEWDRNVLGELENRIRKVRKDLEKCRRMSISQEQVNREHILRYKLERLQDQHHVYWKQRAHITWLTKGDRNTKFFHAQASERRRRNLVEKLEEGVGFVKGKQLKSYIANQYQQLFLTSIDAVSNAQMAEVLECVQSRVTQEMNEALMKPFMDDEIWAALEGIGDLKASGADGFPAIFYKHFWHLVGDRVKEEVQSVLNGGVMPPGWNDTILILIPKVNSLKEAAEIFLELLLPYMLRRWRPFIACSIVHSWG